jgi:hypothetical protein
MPVTDGPMDALDELGSGVDLYDCPECVALADLCEFHHGFGEGWDAAVTLMAERVERDQSAELVGDFETWGWAHRECGPDCLITGDRCEDAGVVGVWS